ncbi:MAG: cbb3-type cytochrome c oxidase subunit I [Nitrospirae bacterium]|nr:cbb3-type cytochrome c oxidase subunit I [Nitrospirota bacterium]
MANPSAEPAKAGTEVSLGLVKFHLVAGLVWLLLGMMAGLTEAYRLTSPAAAEFLGNVPWLNYGRLRFFHTHSVIFGWLSNGFMAFTFYAVPKLVGKGLFLEPVAQFNRKFMQVALAAGAIGLLAGYGEGVEYAEAPWWADVLFAASFVLALLSTVGTVLQGGVKSMYVSLWYIVMAFIFTALNFVMANTIVAHVAPGAAGAALSGLWIHNAVGMWVTPMGAAIAYYLLPVLVRKPIASHKLSLLGFWTLAFLYPLGGSHHYFYSPIPWWLQVVAVPLTSALLFVVYTVVYNFFATMRGSWNRLADDIALRFLTFGIFSYIMTCTQGPFHALLSVQKVVHFTDWIVAHAHLALFGVFSWWIFAFIYFVWPRITGRAIASRALAEWHFWLALIGFFFLYYVPDTAAGLMQGFAWMRGLSIIDSLKAAEPFWVPRAVSGVVLFVSTVLLAINLIKSSRMKPEADGRG